MSQEWGYGLIRVVLPPCEDGARWAVENLPVHIPKHPTELERFQLGKYLVICNLQVYRVGADPRELVPFGGPFAPPLLVTFGLPSLPGKRTWGLYAWARRENTHDPKEWVRLLQPGAPAALAGGFQEFGIEIANPRKDQNALDGVGSVTIEVTRWPAQDIVFAWDD
jgi:hypothetical protein